MNGYNNIIHRIKALNVFKKSGFVTICSSENDERELLIVYEYVKNNDNVQSDVSEFYKLKNNELIPYALKLAGKAKGKKEETVWILSTLKGTEIYIEKYAVSWPIDQPIQPIYKN